MFVLSDTYLLLRLLAFSVHVPLPSSLFLMMCGTGCRMSPRSSLVRPFFCLLLLHFHSSIRSSISPAPAKGRRFLPPLSHFFFFFLEKYTLVVLYTHPPVHLKPASLLVVRRRLIYFWKGFCAPYRFPSPSVPWRVSFRLFLLVSLLVTYVLLLSVSLLSVCLCLFVVFCACLFARSHFSLPILRTSYFVTCSCTTD